MKSFTIQWPLHVGQRFADTAFARSIGKSLDVHLPDGRMVPGRLAAALTFEVGDDVDLPGGDQLLHALSVGEDAS